MDAIDWTSGLWYGICYDDEEQSGYGLLKPFQSKCSE